MTPKWRRIYEDRGLGCATQSFALKLAEKYGHAIVIERNYGGYGVPVYKAWPAAKAIPEGWGPSARHKHLRGERWKEARCAG